LRAGAVKRGTSTRSGHRSRRHDTGPRLPALAAAGLIAVLALAGCAQPSSGSSGDGAAAAPSAPRQASSTVPTVTAPTTSPPATRPATTTVPPAAGDTVTVRGTVRQGVEPGCTLVDGQDGRSYLLIGQGGRRLPAGVRVRVVGQRVETFANTCGEDAALAAVSVTTLG
jgi:hypothetical protein